MKEHEKALRIFVHNIGDFAEAEQYCNQITLGTIHILRTHFKGRGGFKKIQFLYKLRVGYLRRGGSETDNFCSCLQLNKYETAPNFIQISQNLTSDCLLI